MACEEGNDCHAPSIMDFLFKKKKEYSYSLPTAAEWIPLEVFEFVVIEHQTYKFVLLSQVRFWFNKKFAYTLTITWQLLLLILKKINNQVETWRSMYFLNVTDNAVGTLLLLFSADVLSSF